MNCKPLTECLACGSTNLSLTLDLNDQSLANNFQSQPGIDQEYPLAVNRCCRCNHLQLTHVVDPEIIYRNYLYVSGTSRTYLDYMDWYANFVNEMVNVHIQPYTIDTTYSVLDIGCNDGSQLDAFKRLQFDTYGVDPAENLLSTSQAKGHQVVCGFWNDLAVKKLDRKFHVITSQNAFAHIADPLAYLKLVRESLRPTGLMFISTSQADMVVNGEFDTIYHEHISYYNAASMKALVERAGLCLVDVIKTPIHGNSYIFVIARQNLQQSRIENILALEHASGLNNAETYTNWALKVKQLLVDLKNEIDCYRKRDYIIVGYGAAAKGMTLLNASKIALNCVIDDNPLKQGLYCPGTDIPVVSIDWLSDNTSSTDTVVFIPLAWNFYSEIRTRILANRNYRRDIFLRYFPKLLAETGEGAII